MAMHDQLLAIVALIAGGLLGACFDGAQTRGLPCMGSEQCGLGLACIEGYCGGVFLCDNGETLTAASACDQVFDCPAREDELSCEFVACTTNADCGEDYKCAWGICSPLGGNVPLGGECGFDDEWFTDDCDADTVCFGGVCVTDCQSWADCGVGQACNPDTLLCEPGCDPIANNCPEGSGCSWFDTEFLCAQGGAAVGEDCSSVECANGVCLVGSSYAGCMFERCCAPFCNTVTGLPCEAPNGICYTVSDLELPADIGVCASP